MKQKPSRKDRKKQKQAFQGRSRPEKPAKKFGFKDRSGRVHAIGGRGLSASPEAKPTRYDDSEPRTAGGLPRPRGLPSKFKVKLPEPGSAKFKGKRDGRKPDREKRPHRGQDNRSSRSRRDERPRRDDPAAQTLKATVDKNRKGFGFLAFDDRSIEDAFVPPRQAENLFHGDRVEVTRDSRGNIFDLRVLQHRFREVVGRFSPHPMGVERGGWVVYERKRAREEIFVPHLTMPISSEDWVQAKLIFHEKGPYPVTAEITKVFGETLPPSADIGMVAAEYNLIEEHPEAAEREAREFKLDLEDKELWTNRIDLRDTPFITIDGETARDFDDAVYVERNGNDFILWVAIADVSHYVKPGTALNEDAYSRGTSVYFPERAFHMLPRSLSENLCSLKPYEPRLSLVAKMFINRHGAPMKTEIFEAVIQSKRRATYNEIQKEYLENKNNPNWEYATHFELYLILRKMRTGRGSIDFDLPEAELNVKPTGEVISIKNRARIDAHRLIEEFMIAANEAVTEWALARQWPFLYRTHDEPSPQAIEKFRKIAATVGVNLRLSGSVTPRVLADVVEQVAGHPAQDLLNTSLLRSMRQAVYSSTHGGHYGLASTAYTHFTSPIRRYPDLIVHRMLRHAVRVEKKIEEQLTTKHRERLEKELAEIAEHCSYRERLATEAERESIKLKQVRMMSEHLGEEFNGKVVGLAEAGLFVQLDDPYVEGLLTKDSLTDDFYEFDEERMMIFGRRKNQSFKIGDRLRVKVVKANIDLRQIDFILVSRAESRQN